MSVEIKTAGPASAPSAVNEDSSKLPRPSERGTEELVIGLVGPIGSGVTTCGKVLAEHLSNSFGYTTGTTIKMSDLIARYASRVGVIYDPGKPQERTETLQKAGTKLREEYGETVVADLAIAEISASRPKRKSITNDGVATELPAESRRHFTIVDSIKHPSEVEQFRAVYGDAFWLIGVFAPPAARTERLKDRFIEPEEVVRAMRIDEDERNSVGQKVGKTVELSDYFIRNDSESLDALRKSAYRFLEVIFGVGVQTPARDESAMYAAAAAASKSACLSRQVGAVIVSSSGEIIGTGANDVPAFGGGLYGGGVDDARCFRWGGHICHNDDQKSKLVDDAVKKLSAADALQVGKEGVAKTAVAESALKGLIEFSRAVHAEMEAIISVARSGAAGLVGSTLYSTTFPCHSCARHIVAAGINKVVYIEPYAKSLALNLHRDAISTHDGDAGEKVLFVQYEGIGPKNYIRLFYNRNDRKRGGKAIEGVAIRARPVIAEPLDDFEVRESIATGSLRRLSPDSPANLVEKASENGK
jgi:deoxycytidylate deaminase